MDAESPDGEVLRDYRAKRDFARTPEPEGAPGRHDVAERRFVVQRHRARRLHYDFRLEVEGVLVSWAVPKGPTLDPKARRAAFHVEDHPVEYRDFEGVIPRGGYGAGDVIVWDRGTWEPAYGEDPSEALRRGTIHFDLRGEKLRGRFVLVRTGRDNDGREQWLMLHKQDEFAERGWDPESHPRSVKSGRTNDEVAHAPEAMWRSDLPAGDAEVPVGPSGGAGSDNRGARSRPPSEEELEELEKLGSEGVWVLGEREVKLTNLDKVLFPGRDGAEPVTKRELIRYYACVAPVILPYLEGRPLNMHRFPNGTGRPGFWHKEIPRYAPEWLTRWRNPSAKKGESQHYAVIDSTPALAWMANYAAVELHPWTSKIPEVRQPTWAFIDIDPGEKTSYEDVVFLATLYRSALDELSVLSVPKLTGQRGIHIWVPVASGMSFERTRVWVEKLSRVVGGAVPEIVSWTWEKRRRNGLARLDYTQNALNKTLVAPYSVRAAAGAPVSVPVGWDELDETHPHSDSFTIRMLPERLETVGDPFAPLLEHPQELPEL